MIAEELKNLLVGESAVMRALRERIMRVAPSPLPVLIFGPTGAGKELVAQAIHRASGRTGRFVPFNISGIPEPMFADAMFGHVRGAFTNAIASTPGYVREADGGTLFMDEISRLAMANQVTLLRTIETHSVRPVGGTDDRTSDFRVVSATNEELASLARNGAFREDLLYRLCSVTVTVPLLRDRREDMLALSEHILGRIALNYMQCRDEPLRLTSDALRLLEAHDWPGNVRELRSAIECAAYLGDGKIIEAADITAALYSGSGLQSVADVSGAGPVRRSELLALLDRHDWDTAAVALDYGVHRATVYRWMQACALPTRDRRSHVRRSDPVLSTESRDAGEGAGDERRHLREGRMLSRE